MDIYQITDADHSSGATPPELTAGGQGNGKRREPMFKDGFLWFVEESYHFVNPRGFSDWIFFLWNLIPVYRSVSKALKEHRRYG